MSQGNEDHPQNDDGGDIIDYEDDILTVPDWVQDLLQGYIKQRKSLVHKRMKKEEAIKKINSHIANNTCPRSIKPNIKLHVNKDLQNETNIFLQDLNQEYEKKILDHLLETREKELQAIKKEFGAILPKVKDDIQQTMQQLVSNKGLDGDPEHAQRDYHGYINIFMKETRECEKEIRRLNFFRNRKLEEERKEKAAKEALQEADIDMTDPIQRQIKELKDTVIKMQAENNRVQKKPQKHANLHKKKQHPAPQRNFNSNWRKDSNHPNGTGRRTYQNWKVQRPKHKNYSTNWRNRSNNSNSNDRNNTARNRNNQGHGRENQGRQQRYTNTTNRLESNRRSSRKRQN